MGKIIYHSQLLQKKNVRSEKTKVVKDKIKNIYEQVI
jgi:hypothetical protein